MEKQISIPLLIGLSIITLGTYLLFWIIITNLKIQEKKFSNSIERKEEMIRSILIMFILPSIWIIITSILKLFFENSKTLNIISNLGFIFLLFLTLKFIVDFIKEVEEKTHKNMKIELTLFILGFFGIFSFFIPFLSNQITNLFPTFILFATILTQTKYNLYLNILNIKKEKTKQFR